MGCDGMRWDAIGVCDGSNSSDQVLGQLEARGGERKLAGLPVVCCCCCCGVGYAAAAAPLWFAAAAWW